MASSSVAGFRFFDADVSFLRYGAFLAAIIIYALFGSPTPDHPGWPEAAVAALLVCAVGAGGAYEAIRGGRDKPLWFLAGRALLMFGAVLPLAAAAIRGNAGGLILRDVLAFLFLLMPVFLYGLIKNRPSFAPYLAGAAVLLGLAFALRSFPEFRFFASVELFYFANMPTVLFAALLLAGLAGKALLRGLRLQSLITAAGFLFLMLIPLAAFAATAQRASIGALAVYAILLSLIAVWKKPGRALPLLLVAGVVIVVMSPALVGLWEMAARKTAEVGFNMRFQEAAAAWGAVAENPLTVLFGVGWGGVFQSPAVGEVSVNFTHGLLTSMLLKTGLCGVILTLIYLAGLAESLIRLAFRDPVLGLALAAPIFIDVFLYASFKSLDFGLVLLLIPSLLAYSRFRARDSIGDGQGFL